MKTQDVLYLIKALEAGYEVVVKPDAEGWLPWFGGECPVPAGTLVEVRITTSARTTALTDLLYWEHRGEVGDVMAYRVVEQVDPYAELKAANEPGSEKQIRCGELAPWRDSGFGWAWIYDPEEYEIRDKPPEPKRVKLKKQVKLLAWFSGSSLVWKTEDAFMVGWNRMPNLDQVGEVEE